MTDEQILSWIKKNLAVYINQAIAQKGISLYYEAWLAGITARETGGLIARYAPTGAPLANISALMMGDYSQRSGEDMKQYHGFGYTQFDKGSFPDFVKSGDWKDPLKCYLKTIDVMESKRKYLVSRFASLAGDSLTHYMTAAWNAGEGNEAKAIFSHVDIDAYTAGHNYSKDVFELAEMYSDC